MWETGFKWLFGFGVLVFALICVGFFLLIIRIALSFVPEVHFLGLVITAAI